MLRKADDHAPINPGRRQIHPYNCAVRELLSHLDSPWGKEGQKRAASRALSPYQLPLPVPTSKIAGVFPGRGARARLTRFGAG